MMGRQAAPERLFYDFCLEDHVPDDHLLRRIDRFLDLSDVRQKLKSFYCSIGRPSIDPVLMIRMLIVGYCFAIRSGIWRFFSHRNVARPMPARATSDETAISVSSRPA